MSKSNVVWCQLHFHCQYIDSFRFCKVFVFLDKRVTAQLQLGLGSNSE